MTRNVKSKQNHDAPANMVEALPSHMPKGVLKIMQGYLDDEIVVPLDSASCNRFALFGRDIVGAIEQGRIETKKAVLENELKITKEKQHRKEQLREEHLCGRIKKPTRYSPGGV